MDNQKDTKNEDWWNELPESVKVEINESIDQANRGEFITLEEFKKEVGALLIE